MSPMALFTMRIVANALFHETTDLELHHTLGGDLHLLQRAWVLGGASGTFLDLKDAKLAELEPISSAKLIDNRIQEQLDDLLGDDLGLARLGGDSVYKFFFRDGFHRFLSVPVGA